MQGQRPILAPGSVDIQVSGGLAYHLALSSHYRLDQVRAGSCYRWSEGAALALGGIHNSGPLLCRETGCEECLYLAIRVPGTEGGVSGLTYLPC